MTLAELADKYGTDKNVSSYIKDSYEEFFKPFKDKFKSILEIGVGTLDKTMPHSFCGVLNHHPHYKPGGSLRMWRDYFIQANVYGMDIAQDCLIKEDRIETFIADSRDWDQVERVLGELEFDLIIDDGDHNAASQLITFSNLRSFLKPSCVYIIEDVGGGNDGIGMHTMMDRFYNLTSDFAVDLRGNHYILTRGI